MDLLLNFDLIWPMWTFSPIRIFWPILTIADLSWPILISLDLLSWPILISLDLSWPILYLFYTYFVPILYLSCTYLVHILYLILTYLDLSWPILTFRKALQPMQDPACSCLITYSWLVHSLFMNCSFFPWLIHYLFTACSKIFHDMFTTGNWNKFCSFHDLLITIHFFLMTSGWLVHDIFITCWRLVHDFKS